jgi:hypothetical protein
LRGVCPWEDLPVSARRETGKKSSMRRPGWLVIIWLIIGVAVAASNDYFEKLGTIRLILSAVLAVLLWPLVLLGIDLHIKK